MAVSAGYLAFVLDQLQGLDALFHKRMFGGVGLYQDEIFFGLIAGDVLYFKVDQTTRARYEKAGSRAFQPYGEGSYSMSYYEVPAHVFEDREMILAWARQAVAAALRNRSAKKRPAGSPRKRGARRG